MLGPEYYDGRELVVHADAGAAVEAMTEVRRAARDCRRSGIQVWTVLPRDTGYDTVTMGLTYARRARQLGLPGDPRRFGTTDGPDVR